MKISVAIPTYNSANFIGATLDSVLRQTAPPDEILVLDDGSSDNTVALLRSYGPRITVLEQNNQGVAAARNALSQRASGDLVAFLDHDDLWHPGYLEAQSRLFLAHPQAVAFFTGHANFEGAGGYSWKDGQISGDPAQLMPPLVFFERYSATTGLFGSMSFCCVPKRVLTLMGSEPFRISGVDDSYLCTAMPLLGPVVYMPTCLVAYRLTTGAQSANRLKSKGLWVKVFELLEERYRAQNNPRLRRAFQLSFALTRRRYGMLLMGAGRVPEARQSFRQAMQTSGSPVSMSKALALWFLTFLPAAAQPAWPASERQSVAAR